MYEEIFNQIRSAANKRNLKDSTIHAYCTSVAHFLNHTAKDIDALTTDDVDIFLTEKKLSGISPETYNHYHSGIRFFYKKVLKMNWDDDDIPRMKRDRKLPTVLTKAEISAILDATPNLKHKAMIATMYSGGLRVSEVTHLHYDDISRKNKTIHIREGKSRSDRYTLLADRTLEILTEYWFYQSEDENSGEFTYFAFSPDTMATTYHLEFRYAEDLDDLQSWFEGDYAYWNASAIAEDYDQETLKNVITLFATENLPESK